MTHTQVVWLIDAFAYAVVAFLLFWQWRSLRTLEKRLGIVEAREQITARYVDRLLRMEVVYRGNVDMATRHVLKRIDEADGSEASSSGAGPEGPYAA